MTEREQEDSWRCSASGHPDDSYLPTHTRLEGLGCRRCRLAPNPNRVAFWNSIGGSGPDRNLYRPYMMTIVIAA